MLITIVAGQPASQLHEISWTFAKLIANRLFSFHMMERRIDFSDWNWNCEEDSVYFLCVKVDNTSATLFLFMRASCLTRSAELSPLANNCNCNCNYIYTEVVFVNESSFAWCVWAATCCCLEATNNLISLPSHKVYIFTLHFSSHLISSCLISSYNWPTKTFFQVQR